MAQWLGPLCALLAWTPVAQARSSEVFVVDDAGRATRLSESRLSLTRSAPSVQQAATPPQPSFGDGVRFVLSGVVAAAPALELETFSAEKSKLDRLRVVLAPGACPVGVPSPCATSPLVRLVVDAVDRDHPSARARSILAELGGTLAARYAAEGPTHASIVAPSLDAQGSERVRVRTRFILVKLAPAGALPIGHDRGAARGLVHAALSKSSGLWASCGLSLGNPRDLPIEVVDPPPAHLIAVGCSHGLPASGGALRVAIEGRRVAVDVPRGTTPSEAARRLARAIEDAGFVVEISDNPRIASAALPTTDLLVRRANGERLEVSAWSGADAGSDRSVSTDATLGVCIGGVDLEDGLQHFGDVDSAVGTLEERTLLKAFDDHDPTTLDVYVVPGFGRGGRIGESFILSDHGSLASVVILDRAGMRPSRASLTLAHEVGHVLLDDPGHPDDFALDTPTALMDADASDATAFGPRRLSLGECRRAWRQSGPTSPVRLLSPWSLSDR